MAQHREESVRTPKTALRESLVNSFRPSNGNGFKTRNKVMAAVVAVGAFAAIGQPLAANAGGDEEQHAAVQPLAHHQPLSAAAAGTPQAPGSVQLLGAQPANGSQAEVHKIDKSKSIEQARAAQSEAKPVSQASAAAPAAPAAEKSGSGYVKPTDGQYTSGFGSRWGSTHKGIDLANSIGTPIKSVSDGKVISAGPASGFGQWVRVQHNDGTITVYGHINTIDVKSGQKVSAGQQIATLGNRGESTGPHLHFEVIKDGSKVNPLPWLESKGISVK